MTTVEVAIMAANLVYVFMDVSPFSALEE
jgi:hypothetical protein